MKHITIDNHREILNNDQLENIVHNLGFTNPMDVAVYVRETYEFQRIKDKAIMKYMVKTLEDFFTLMDDVETSDSGTEIKTFSLGCSVTSMCVKMEDVLAKMKELSKVDMEKTVNIKIENNE